MVLPSSSGEQPSSSGGSRRTLPRIFKNELRAMMYGFGDVVNPRPDSVALMEELVLEYFATLVKKSTEVAHAQRRERPDVTDIKVVVRKDRRKINRVRYLLEMKTQIQQVTQFNVDEHAGAIK